MRTRKQQRTVKSKSRRVTSNIVGSIVLLLLGSMGSVCPAQPPMPAVDDVRTQVPETVKDIEMLFSGKPEELKQNWVDAGNAGKPTAKPPQWRVKEGAMIANRAYIATKSVYTDFQLHIEFWVPNRPGAKGQAKGNSGIFLQGRYEVQILDSYGVETPGTGDCGAIYRVAAPLVNACLPPETWQTYDIAFHAPRFDPTSHAMTEPARVSVWLNGVAIQNQTEVTHNTHTPPKKKGPDGKLIEMPLPIEDLSTPGPITLQYHGNAVAFRNIWIRPLKDVGNTKYE